MLAKTFSTTPEQIIWGMRYDRALIYQAAILSSEDRWVIPYTPPPPPVHADDFDSLLTSEPES